MSWPPGRFALFIGVGHPFRRDDAVGPWLAERLIANGCRAIVHAGDGAGLLDLFSEASAILVADAMQSGRPAGDAVLFDARETDLPAGAFRSSTHEFGLAHAVETARSLGLLPSTLWVLGVEGQDFGFGGSLTPPVAAAASALLPVLIERCRPPPQE